MIKPLIGPQQIGPSDAAVIRPKLDSYRGVALALRPGAARRRPLRRWRSPRSTRRSATSSRVGADPDADRDPRQLLLAERRRRADDGRRWSAPAKPAATRPSRTASRSSAARTSLHNQFTNSRDRRGHPHPQHAADQRDRRDRRRAQVRDDGPEEARESAGTGVSPQSTSTGSCGAGGNPPGGRAASSAPELSAPRTMSVTADGWSRRRKWRSPPVWG